MSTVFGPCQQSWLSANSNMCKHTSYMRRHVCSKVNSDSLYNQTHVKHWALDARETLKKSLLKSPSETSCSLAPVTQTKQFRTSLYCVSDTVFTSEESLWISFETPQKNLPENLFAQSKQMTLHMEVQWHTQIILYVVFSLSAAIWGHIFVCNILI